MSIHVPILRRCLLHPFRVAMIDDQRSWRGIDVLVAAAYIAERIEALSESRTVGVMLPTGGAFAPAALAAWSLGRVIVPLNYLLSPEELEYVTSHSGVDLIITARRLLEHIDSPPRGARFFKLDEADFRGVPEPRLPARAAPDDLAALLYTSGTSGKPKGVMLTHGNLRANVRQCREWVRFDTSDTLLGVLPQFHSFGFTVLTLVPLTCGARVVYTARFVPHRIISLLREHHPTAFIGIPSMYNALLSVKDGGPDDFRSIRYCVSGGEPLSDAVFERFLERFEIRICEGYGLTETAPVTNWCRPWEFRRGSVGKPLPDVQERIIDLETGRTLNPGEDGEIRIKGPNVMQGYYRYPEGTRETFDDDGWFRTGDYGRLSVDGHLSITGRVKDMMIIGGENVFPREIEEALSSHEAVAASGVIGMTDPMRGETPVAFVTLQEGKSVSEQDLRAWCRERIAAFKAPRQIHFVDELPTGPTGKVLRRALPNLLPESSKAEQASS